MPDLHVGELGNVVCMTFAAPEEENAFFLAHLDTVFPEETPLIIRVDGSRRSCPGIGGQHGQRGPADAGDETHGRAQRLGRDLYRDEVNTSCIGSLRHRIAVEVQGVYFFHDLGRPKAVAVLASAIDRLYRFAPSGTHMTYNVDTLQGGTSVNVITQKASALFEHRSEGVRALRECDKFLKSMLEGFMWPDVRVRLETVGEGGFDAQAIRESAAVRSEAIEAEAGVAPAWSRASTDCNIPLSIGIPAVCCGLCRGGGAHTLQEWIDIASVPAGARAALQILEGRPQ